ncbi:MAG TPA: TonB-dependent receptor [Vicinamibacteria bacterium]|nr:TonB-dependent receptor [Vicinamibacteria bacterium]
MRKIHATTALLLLLLAQVRTAGAQSTRGSIVGVTLDPSLLVAPATAVTARNLEENTTQATVSDGNGLFQLVNLKPGRYEVAATKDGFAPVVLPPLTLAARQTLRVEVTLQVATASESVEVTSDVGRVDTETGTLSASQAFHDVMQLPVNTRGATTSALGAIAVMPGVQQDTSGNVSIGGAPPSQIGYSVDGVSTANNRQNGALANLYPSSEILDEIKVTAFNNNAEFAQIGDVTVTTKGGGNGFHGSVFEYHQDDALDARTYGFETKAPKKFDTFGGSLSGPLVKNRAFFFVDYEGNRRRTSAPLQLLVPTAAERAGDLSALAAAPVLDPATGRPFPGNVIPADRINATARALLDGYYPMPNSSASPSANLLLQTPTPSNTDGFDARVDLWASTQHSLYVRVSWKDVSSTVQNGLLPSETAAEQNRNLLLSHNYTINSKLVNELRLGMSRVSSHVSFPIRGADALAQLGVTGLDLGDHPDTHAFPVFNFGDGTGFTPIGRDKTGTSRSTTLQLTDNLTWTKGRHNLRFGVDVRRLGYYDLESFGGANDFGQFVFSAGQFTGNAFADFLLGLPTYTYVAQSGPDIDAHTTQYAAYAQDEWRLGDRLTLNLGLRYAVMPAFVDRNGNLGAFNVQDGGMIVPDALQPRAEFLRSINACGTGPGGGGLRADLPCVSVRSASEAGLPQGLRRTDFGNLQPRLSFAYRPLADNSTVVRGGWGLFTVTSLGQLSFNTTDIASSVVRTYANADPATGAPRYSFPAAFYAATTQEFIGASDFYQNTPTGYRDPQVMQWNLTVEREIPGQMVLSASYVGMRSYRMNVTVDLNQVAPSARPYDAARKPYPTWNRILSSENLGSGNYEALQAGLNRRLRGGLTFQASYTWAKNLADYGGDAPSGFTPEVIYGTAVADRYHLDALRGNVAGTRRHRFLLSGLYELPLARNNRFLGGWQVSTVALLQTGPYLTPTFSAALVDPANLNIFNRGSILRPDRIGDGNLANPTPDHYFDIGAFAAPPANAGRIGNSGVGILVGPGTVAISAGLSKTFPLSGRTRLRLDTTFTNLPNHPNFAPPAVDVSTPATFGRTTTVQTAEGAGNRVGQVSLRLEF